MDLLQEVLAYIAEYRSKNTKEMLTIAIDGMCGAGKSTLGKLLQESLGGNLFHMDDFFLQPHQRTAERMEQPGGNVDYERFQAEVLEHLEDEQGFSYGVFNCKSQCIDKKIFVNKEKTNIIEGSYCLHPYFRNIADICIFLQVEPNEQMRRIRGRNGEEQVKRFVEEWIPKENCYFDTFEIRNKCICLDTTDKVLEQSNEK